MAVAMNGEARRSLHDVHPLTGRGPATCRGSPTIIDDTLRHVDARGVGPRPDEAARRESSPRFEAHLADTAPWICLFTGKHLHGATEAVDAFEGRARRDRSSGLVDVDAVE